MNHLAFGRRSYTRLACFRRSDKARSHYDLKLALLLPSLADLLILPCSSAAVDRTALLIVSDVLEQFRLRRDSRRGSDENRATADRHVGGWESDLHPFHSFVV